MADKVDVQNWPKASSAEQVAFELFKWLRNITDQAERKKHLDQFAECLAAAKGHRDIT